MEQDQGAVRARTLESLHRFLSEYGPSLSDREYRVMVAALSVVQHAAAR